MRNRTLTLAIILTLLGSACGSRPRTTKRYDKDGINFSHYSDWEVTEDETDENEPSSRTITLEGPNEALVMFICLPPQTEATAESFAQAMPLNRAEMMGKIKIGPIKPADISDEPPEPITGRISGRVRKGVLQRFSIKMLGQVIPHEMKVFAVEQDRFKVFIVAQVATKDLRSTTPAFDLTLDSFAIR